MTVELSATDLDLLIKALESHEKESLTSNLMGEMLAAILAGKSSQEPDFIETRDRLKRDAERETESRKGRCLMLRARLTETKLREKEFSR